MVSSIGKHVFLIRHEQPNPKLPSAHSPAAQKSYGHQEAAGDLLGVRECLHPYSGWTEVGGIRSLQGSCWAIQPGRELGIWQQRPSWAQSSPAKSCPFSTSPTLKSCTATSHWQLHCGIFLVLRPSTDWCQPNSSTPLLLGVTNVLYSSSASGTHIELASCMRVPLALQPAAVEWNVSVTVPFAAVWTGTDASYKDECLNKYIFCRRRNRRTPWE